MNKIDKAFNKFSNFRGYTGNPPTNENEYNELLNDSSRYFQGNPVFEGTAPSWSAIQSKVDEIVDAKASALAKLSALGLTEEEVQAIIK
jgi:hypothetical protein